jgi:hypothetical protein
MTKWRQYGKGYGMIRRLQFGMVLVCILPLVGLLGSCSPVQEGDVDVDASQWLSSKRVEALSQQHWGDSVHYSTTNVENERIRRCGTITVDGKSLEVGVYSFSYSLSGGWSIHQSNFLVVFDEKDYLAGEWVPDDPDSVVPEGNQVLVATGGSRRLFECVRNANDGEYELRILEIDH